MIVLNQQLLEYAVLGGAILGGGGGGSRALGMRLGQAALMYNPPVLLDIDEIDPEALVVTASAVGAPAAVDGQADPKDYVRAVRLLEEKMNCKMAGIITNENGGTASINGWIQSAVLNIPLIDAPCNGRAHPTGSMGSMGLHNQIGFISYQAAVGGKPELDKYLEVVTQGSLNTSASLVRKAADMAGGLVAVARNPVKAKYIRQHGAPGAIKHAIDIGRVFSQAKATPLKAIEAVAAFLNGAIAVIGKVSEYKIETRNAFDVGIVEVDGVEITFWNEYMTLEKNGQRLASFPDLIMSFDLDSGYPVTTAELKQGQNIAVLVSDKSNLKLGAGVKDKLLLQEVEQIINKAIV